MKKLLLPLLALGALQIQAQELPMPSPNATVEQRVGLTDIKIEYSRPGVKDREIFGDLVPYNELWRTGANQIPNITFSTDLTFNGVAVDAGTYSLLTIPTEGNWTIILNKNTEMWGTDGYKKEEDVLRTEVASSGASFTESFTIEVNDISNESANLVFRWAETEVKVPMEVKVHEYAIANIEKALSDDSEEAQENKWRVYRNAANYYMNNDMDLNVAMEYLNKSLDLKADNWYSYWMKAELFAAQKNYKDAIKTAEKSMKMGQEAAAEAGRDFGYADMINKGIAEWKEMKKES